ncbi:DUF222 domain-containing protein, partial [Arthrobacter sp. YAF17]|uniref:DUF222 domain-containing protein n=1 Tax=Arthrobacter sp. YAF17 TaxID=3233077 RepID=UPI003F91830B
MKAAKDFITVEDPGRGTAPAGHSGAARVEGLHSTDSPVSTDGLKSALALLQDASSTAAGDAAFMGFREAADFAGTVEEISRIAEYLQLVAARAVDRTRKQAAATATVAGTAWTTGWRDDTGYGDPAAPDDDSGAASGAVAVTAAVARSAADSGAAVDDGYRNTAEFLRARLRISAAESRRRLSLGEALLPRQGFAGEPLPAVHAELGAAVAAGEVASRAATIISLALDRVRHACDAEAAARMEHALTRTAAENDPDFLSRMARSWIDAVDQDGAEPSEELLRQLQGAFIRKPRHGLQHLEIFATAGQFEHLLTVMNTATNPRTSAPAPTGSPSGGTETEPERAAAADGTHGANDGVDVPLDLRSRPQKLLDGLVGGCKVALAAGTLPATGGLRPQVLVTIDYRDLLDRLSSTNGEGTIQAHTGTLLFTGPVTASTARKIACDADIIPVLLGGEGRILDIGRASRVFPP